MKKYKLSVVLATRNEEENIARCLESVKNIADEIVVVDEHSTDRTLEIVKKYNTRIFKVKHEPIFHITKQKAIDEARGKWILQLDADEVVSNTLALEIKKVINMTNDEVATYQKLQKSKYPKLQQLFEKHQKLIEEREGKLGKKTGDVVAFFIPRLNFFLNKPLKYAGVYPDGVIRLIKEGKARLPGKSVHELMEVDGEIGWLFNDLEHHESPSLRRYLERANRYTDLSKERLEKESVSKNPIQLFNYSIIKPLATFFSLYVRHKGFLDGVRGFLWSFLSAIHHPISYFKYWSSK